MKYLKKTGKFHLCGIVYRTVDGLEAARKMGQRERQVSILYLSYII